MITLDVINIDEMEKVLREEMNKTYTIADEPTKEQYEYIKKWIEDDSEDDDEIECEEYDEECCYGDYIINLWKNTLKGYLEDGYSLDSALFDYFH